jgi:hypothetical protein
MSTQYETLLEPLQYTFNAHSLDLLKSTGKDIIASDGMLQNPEASFDFFQIFRHVGVNTARAQAFGLKPAITIGQIDAKSGVNCSDFTGAMLQLSEQVGVRTLAMYNGWHANIVAPANSTSCWEVEDHTAPKLRYVSTEVPGNAWPSEVTPPASNDDSYRAILYVARQPRKLLEAHFLNGDDLSAETSSIVCDAPYELSTQNFIVVKPSLAFPMLRAMDILRTMRHRTELNPELRPFQDEVTERFKHLIPRLKPPKRTDKVQ